IVLLFESRCGTGARCKRASAELFHAPREIVEAFIRAYVEGDGHRYASGLVSAATVSRSLALGVAWLVLKTGRFPSIRRKRQPEEGRVLGRTVRLATNVLPLNRFEAASHRARLRYDDR